VAAEAISGELGPAARSRMTTAANSPGTRRLIRNQDDATLDAKGTPLGEFSALGSDFQSENAWSPWRA
jgi:hypothetical protein